MARARGSRSSAPEAVAEQEFHVYRVCEFCKYNACVNNNAERKVKITKFRGMFMCAYCQNVLKNRPILTGALRFLFSFASQGCMAQGKKNKKKCRCDPCQARRIISEV